MLLSTLRICRDRLLSSPMAESGETEGVKSEGRDWWVFVLPTSHHAVKLELQLLNVTFSYCEPRLCQPQRERGERFRIEVMREL